MLNQLKCKNCEPPKQLQSNEVVLRKYQKRIESFCTAIVGNSSVNYHVLFDVEYLLQHREISSGFQFSIDFID